MKQEDQTLSQENIDAVLKYMDMSPRDALKVEAAKIMRALRKSEEEIRNAALEEAALLCEKIGDEYNEREGRRYPELRTDAVGGCQDCESSIRALKTAAPSKGEGS